MQRDIYKQPNAVQSFIVLTVVSARASMSSCAHDLGPLFTASDDRRNTKSRCQQHRYIGLAGLIVDCSRNVCAYTGIGKPQSISLSLTKIGVYFGKMPSRDTSAHHINCSIGNISAVVSQSICCERLLGFSVSKRSVLNKLLLISHVFRIGM